MSIYTELANKCSDLIERTTDEIIEEVIDVDECVSSETWLAVKAKLLAFLDAIAEQIEAHDAD